MVLEGVHLVPGMLPEIDGALVAQCVLEVEDPKQHSSHFLVRDAGSNGVRPHDKYVDRLADIRRIQASIVARAERHDVPVVETANLDLAIGRVIDLVLAAAEEVQPVS